MGQHLIPPAVGQSTKMERHTFWHKAIALFEKSGLKRRDFCKQHGLDAEEFRRWRFRLTQKKASSSARQDKQPHRHESIPSFVPLQIEGKHEAPSPQKKSRTDASALRLILNTPADLQVLIPAGFDAQSLSRLLRVLEIK